MYQMWCQVQPPSPHQPTTSRPCPQSKRWPRTQTAAALTHCQGHWMRVSEHIPRPRVCLSACSPFTISKHQPSPFFLLFTPSYPHFVCFFVPFVSWVFSFLLNLNEKVYFSIFFLCVTFILLILFNFTLCVRTAGQGGQSCRYGYCLTWSSMYDVRIHMDFQVTRSRWGGCCLFCLPVF